MIHTILFKEKFMVREVNFDDLQGLLKLYTQLHDNPLPEKSEELLTMWKK